jgi:hypothetical protein
MPFDPGARRRGLSLAVIPIMEAEEVEAVVREEVQPACQHIDFIKIEKHVENAVAQPMLSWPQSVMHH